ncbi:MAG TPA: ornithine carbamoyltransferase, partial [Rhodospirillales bacterium]|nr:ornithine carbamoyltransferase [Rhodospirillales bacterium]
MTAVKHFLDLDRFDTKTLRDILDLAGSLKRAHADGVSKPVFAGKTLVMIFEKPSTRTRVSFQVGMQHLGGQVVVMSDAESQLGRGESIADTARVLSRYADAIMIRTDDPKKLEDLEAYATVPVINGLTNYSHPCQIMADVMTYEEHRGPIKGRVVAWSGDGNNVANSWIHAAVRFGFTLRLACPDSLKPAPEILQWAVSEGGDITVTDDAAAAVDGADLVNADTWVSMGDADADARMKLLEPFRVDQALMAGAKADAL